MSDSFIIFKRVLTEKINNMLSDPGNTLLFRTSVSYKDMWSTYLNSFPSGTNNIFRVRTEHDCSCCRFFIRDFGNVVASNDGILESIWDISDAPYPYNIVCAEMSKLVKTRISEIFWSKFEKIGVNSNVELLDTDKRVVTWEHLFYALPKPYFNRFKGRSKGDYCGEFESAVNTLKRGLNEIKTQAIEDVLQLIKDGSLYRGSEWGSSLELLYSIKSHYLKLTDCELGDARSENYIWETVSKYGLVFSKIRNHSIGTLLVNLSEGMDIDEAVTKYEQIVAPTNYKRPKEIYTKKMLEDAKKELNALGYMDSLHRRYAIKDDVPISNAIFFDSFASSLRPNDIFDEMLKETTEDVRKFKNVEEMSFEDFKKYEVPHANSIEVLLENRHSKNFMSLIAPENKESKSMFKWGNPISWAYTGNITDSNIKENVKIAGGNVECDLRFSIQWNDHPENGCNNNDLDSHCIEYTKSVSDGYEIYYGNARTMSPNGGMLDVDIRYPISGKPSVENICYTNIKRLIGKKLLFAVHCFDKRRGNQDGFRAELDILGNVYSFNYEKPIGNKEFIKVAEVCIDKNGDANVKCLIPESEKTSKTVWGLKTNAFHKVSMIIPSPNCWGEHEIGNAHTFFIIPGAINPEMPNAFYNEFLDERLNKYKRFMAALGGKLKVEDSENQLSGIGFSKTIKNNVIVRINGGKVIKVIF